MLAFLKSADFALITHARCLDGLTCAKLINEAVEEVSVLYYQYGDSKQLTEFVQGCGKTSFIVCDVSGIVTSDAGKWFIGGLPVEGKLAFIDHHYSSLELLDSDLSKTALCDTAELTQKKYTLSGPDVEICVDLSKSASKILAELLKIDREFIDIVDVLDTWRQPSPNHKILYVAFMNTYKNAASIADEDWNMRVSAADSHYCKMIVETTQIYEIATMFMTSLVKNALIRTMNFEGKTYFVKFIQSVPYSNLLENDKKDQLLIIYKPHKRGFLLKLRCHVKADLNLPELIKHMEWGTGGGHLTAATTIVDYQTFKKMIA